MTYDDYVSDRERRIAKWLTIGMHAAILVLFVFGVAWQKRHMEPAAIVDLWSSVTPPREAPPPVPKPVPVAKAEVKPQPKPEPAPPKPEVKPVPKPDIALKEKLEKERKLKEQQELERKKELEERRKDEEKKKLQQAEVRKKEEEKRKLEKERLTKENEAKRIAQEQADIKAKLQKEQASAQRALFDKYVSAIQNHVKRQIVEPPNLQGNPQVEFNVVLIPGGEVLTARMTRSSGVPAYDAAVERAILKASPLPLPPDPTLFQNFRELNLRIRPRE
jgi:colicin import membrane protein